MKVGITLFLVCSCLPLVVAAPSRVSDRATRLRQHDWVLYAVPGTSSLVSSRQLEDTWFYGG